MHLKHLSLTNFRNFARLDVSLPKRAILLTGANAQGKTSVLEAVYFMAAFASFQTHADRQIVNFLAAKESLAVARIVGEFTRGTRNHRVEVRLILEGVGALGQRLRKEVLIDGVKKPLSEAIGLFNAVLFVPQMTQIIEGTPDDRRRYLNLTLAQIVPGYARALSEYGKAIEQRNALLKLLAERGGDAEQLVFWDEKIAAHGAQLIHARIHSVAELEKLAARTHHELTHGTEVLRIAYDPSYDPVPRPSGQITLKLDTPVERTTFDIAKIQAGFLQRLKQVRAEEIARGVTTIGPHRDEMRFLANGIDLGDYGSRGQVRTALLALKLAEVDWMKARTGEWPVILLDEVMAELDPQRRADLQTYLGGAEQSLLTTTDLALFTKDFAETSEVWQVMNGTIKT